jgi:hypothetical protein
MDDTLTQQAWRTETLATPACPGYRWAAVATVDAEGRTAAVADLYGPAACDWVELSLQLCPERPQAEAVGELVRLAAGVAAAAGADRLILELDPVHRLLREVVAVSGLDWRVVTTDDTALAELALDRAGVPVPAPGTAAYS